jgi:hypothetical protein
MSTESGHLQQLGNASALVIEAALSAAMRSRYRILEAVQLSADRTDSSRGEPGQARFRW